MFFAVHTKIGEQNNAFERVQNYVGIVVKHQSFVSDLVLLSLI